MNLKDLLEKPDPLADDPDLHELVTDWDVLFHAQRPSPRNHYMGKRPKKRPAK